MRISFLVILLSWVFLGCNPMPKEEVQNPLSEAAKSTYLKKGKAIAGETFTALSGKLQTAMQAGGVEEAIQYCNLNAMPIVDSLSQVHDAIIRRTSLKTRNQLNTPSKQEQSILTAYDSLDKAGGDLKPIVSLLDDQQVAFYAPIRVNAFCLQCHGKPGETLKEEDNAIIQQHYPSDKAIGYQDGDLRGMWSIRFKRGKE